MTITAKSLQPFFPYVPDYMSWEDWTGNMIIHYGQQNVMLTSEEDWKIGAENMAKIESFSAYPVPNPQLYDNWDEWAREFSLIINGKSY